MKILVVCQYYYPEPFRISDYCEELVKQGHEITVLTGTPNYPEGNIYIGYEGCDMNGYSNESINGVTVKRCRIIPRKSGALYRFLNYYSYSIMACKRVKELDADYDVILVNQLSPVMMAYPAIKYKKKYKKKIVLYCLDLWPESLCTGGIKKGGIVYKVFHWISKKIYCQCDQILVTSKEFSRYFADEFDINTEKIKYLPQYAEDIFECDLSENNSKNDINCCDLVFAGNVGAAQNVKSIIYAAKKLENENVKIHIVGDGSELKNCKETALDLGLSNVAFYGRKPLSDMPKFYQMADAMLLTLVKDEILSMTLPGKIQSYMLAGRAIIGAIDGAGRSVIEESNCGYCGSAEDVDELVSNIRRFMELSFSRRENLQRNALKYYSENFARENFIRKLEQIMKENKV